MSDISLSKKKWSKKKKIVVVVLSMLLALVVLATAAGVIALNWYCKTAEYEVVSTDLPVTLVAHRGMRSVAPENTTASFEQAGERGYWGAECDIYRTKDGVWVVSHDVNTYRMMDKSVNIEKKTYSELLELTVDNGSQIENYPGLKICSFEEYLQICKDYNMTAVIEFKGNHNIEYYNEVVDLASQYGVDTIYISFEFEDLEAMRRLTDSKMYYLVKNISDEDIELAKGLENCGIDFNGNNEKNYKTDIIKKAQNAGLDLGAWTINDTQTLEKLVNDYGVTLITTDAITY